MSSNAENDGYSSPENDSGTKYSQGTNLFVLYAKVFKLMLAKWISRLEEEEAQREKELEELILPSNEEWRHRVYYRLVELQRESDAITMDAEMENRQRSKELQLLEWAPDKRLASVKPRLDESLESTISLATAQDASMTDACIDPGWSIEDLILASKVLQNFKPPPEYVDEAEMRRVFGLVYDVLRYKSVLSHALDDVSFWPRHQDLKEYERVVWLLLYDMQGRKFARRGEIDAVQERERIFEAVGLKNIEDSLLELKTRLAASVSRLRIEGSALSLGELLPPYLRTIENVSWTDGVAVTSGWVNTAKLGNKAEFVKAMAELDLNLCTDCQTVEISDDTYVFDPVCPKVVNLHEKARKKLAKFYLIRNHNFIFMERTLCLGAAAVVQAIQNYNLCGPVVLTHCIAPRHTAYLASLLSDVVDCGRVLAFGAAEHRCEYETYLRDLGVTLPQCRVFSEKYTSPPPSPEIERATVVLATPPCSYTGIKDIVDLAVARGGDVKLLENFTTADYAKNSRSYLAEQLATLKHALTRPHVQFLIYEAHSVLPSETTQMIEQVVDYANRIAMEKYIRDHPPKKKPKSDAESRKRAKAEEDEDDTKSIPTVALGNVKVPDSDLFEIANIKEIFDGYNTSVLEPGCFLSVIKRKEMMQFNSLFMIKVAESKNLFGDPNKQSVVKEESVVQQKQSFASILRKEFMSSKIQIDRLLTPTHSSTLRTAKQSRSCPRYDQRVAHDERRLTSLIRECRRRDARRWWTEAISFLIDNARDKSSDEFHITRTDPITHRTRYPFCIEEIALPEAKKKDCTNSLLLRAVLSPALPHPFSQLSTKELKSDLLENLCSPSPSPVQDQRTHLQHGKLTGKKRKESTKHRDKMLPQTTVSERKPRLKNTEIAREVCESSQTSSLDIACLDDPDEPIIINFGAEAGSFDAISDDLAPSSTVLRPSALHRATRRSFLRNVLNEHERGEAVVLNRIPRIYPYSPRRSPRLTHRHRPRKMGRLYLGTQLETLPEHAREIPHTSPRQGRSGSNARSRKA